MPSPNRDDGDALAVPTDVAEQQQVRVLVDKAVETYGRIDVMLNNAGLMPLAPFEKLKTDEWDRMIDVDFKGVRYGIAAALPHMKKQKSGHFINVCNQPNGLEAAHIQRQWDTPTTCRRRRGTCRNANWAAGRLIFEPKSRHQAQRGASDGVTGASC